MKFRPFVITDVVIAEIEKVKKYAHEHPFTKEAIEALINGTGECAGDNENLKVVIPVDYRIVYSVEHQPSGPCRHISISVSGKGNWPSLIAVDEILAFFDFKVRINDDNNTHEAHMWQDEETESVNILELI